MNSTKLGDFSFEGESDDTFYLQNGFYRFAGKWKQRGFGNVGSKEIEHIDTIEKDGKLIAKMNVLRNTRLRSSILQNNIKDVGKIRMIQREINLNADRKRFWCNNITSIKQKNYNDSLPLSLDFLEKSMI